MKQILIIGVDAKEFLEEIGFLLDKKISIQKEVTKRNEFSNYLTRIEVASLLKITLPTLNEWTKLGWLKAYKMGHRVLYNPEEVHEALTKVSINKRKKYIS